MTQHEYLKQLEDALSALDPKDKDELMTDFSEHFAIGLSQGKSEEEIIESLGSVKDLIESLDLKRLTNQKAETQGNNKSFNEKVENVIIDGRHADVTIVASEDDQTHVDYDISKRILGKLATEITTRQEGKTLLVAVTSTNKIFMNSLDAVDLMLRLPKNLVDVNCKTASGDIHINALNIESLQLHSLSGDIEADTVKTKTLNATTISGNLSLHNVSGNLSVKGVSGDIEMLAHCGDACILETVSGDIEYKGTSTEMRISTTSGDGSCEAEDLEVLHVETVSGDFEFDLDIEKKGLTIAFSSTSGELRIGDAEYDAVRHNRTIVIGNGELKVDLKSVSGDFEIE